MNTNTKIKTMGCLFLAVSLNGLFSLNAHEEHGIDHLKTEGGQVLSEQVGQGINYPTPGQGAQFGYFTFIKGIPQVFDGAPENEATAVLTFYQDLTNVRVSTNGPI